jgi:hypothetical protein
VSPRPAEPQLNRLPNIRRALLPRLMGSARLAAALLCRHYELRINKHRRARNLAAALQAVTGQTIIIRDGQAIIVQPDAA